MAWLGLGARAEVGGQSAGDGGLMIAVGGSNMVVAVGKGGGGGDDDGDSDVMSVAMLVMLMVKVTAGRTGGHGGRGVIPTLPMLIVA